MNVTPIVYIAISSGESILGQFVREDDDKTIMTLKDPMLFSIVNTQAGPEIIMKRYLPGSVDGVIDFASDKILSTSRPNDDIIQTYATILDYNQKIIDQKIVDSSVKLRDAAGRMMYVNTCKETKTDVDIEKALSPDAMTAILENLNVEDMIEN